MASPRHPEHSFRKAVILIAVLAWISAACGVKPAIERLSDARQASADLQIRFSHASDASNRAVMADTDEASIAFAKEADEGIQAVQADINTLDSLLKSLGYEEEVRLLQEFVSRFAKYRQVDSEILKLAVQNTNIKAQHLSFESGQQSADALRDALETIAPQGDSREAWRTKALVKDVIASVREIQTLQAPHIASADDAVMTDLEKRMGAAEAAARSGLRTLEASAPAAARAKVAAASAALDKFLATHTEIIALSRRNTNVRSLELSMNEKGKLTASCQQSLRALRDALAARETHGTR